MCAAAVAIALVLAALLASGALNGGSADSERPPCEDLGTRSQAEAALAAHPALVTLLRNAGSTGITVTDPCGTADRSIITVTYARADRRQSIDQVLSTQPGFGVAVEVVRD
jgi:hypothetical protein